jgi:hypothetical protein
MDGERAAASGKCTFLYQALTCRTSFYADVPQATRAELIISLAATKRRGHHAAWKHRLAISDLPQDAVVIAAHVGFVAVAASKCAGQLGLAFQPCGHHKLWASSNALKPAAQRPHVAPGRLIHKFADIAPDVVEAMVVVDAWRLRDCECILSVVARASPPDWCMADAHIGRCDRDCPSRHTPLI